MQAATHAPTEDADDHEGAHPDAQAAAIATIAADEMNEAQARLLQAQRAPIDRAFERGQPRPRAQAPSVFDMGRDTLQAPSATLSPVNITGADDYAEEDATTVQPAVNALAAMHEAATKVIEAREAVKLDSTLTPAAQLLAIDAMQDKLWPAATRKVDAANAWLTQAISTAEQELRAPIRTNATGPYAAELRSLVRAMDTAARMKFITAAIADADAVTVGALLGGAPAALAGLNAEMVSALTEQWQRARNPQAVRKLNLMKSAQAKMERAAGVFITTREQTMGARFETVRRLRDQQSATRRVVGAIA